MAFVRDDRHKTGGNRSWTLVTRVKTSALGQKQTCAVQKVMSALPPKADMCSATRYVRFVPIADITNLFDHLTSEAKNGGGYFDPKRFCCF